MHPNPVFRGEAEARNIDFARSRAFGSLVVNGPNGPLLAHIPFLLADDASEARLHLVRSNPIARLAAGPAVLAVNGPDGYVSPDWYGVADQVPTWNYVAVHLRGHLEPRPMESMKALLDAQSAHFENQLSGKTPWTTNKMTPGVMERMMRAILPFRLRIEHVDGTWKLSQNKDDVVRRRAADQIATGLGQGQQDLAAMMRGVPDKDG